LHNLAHPCRLHDDCIMVMIPDPYKALGLPHSASEKQIKTSYRKLALNLHPDRLVRTNATEQERKDAAKKFAAIQAAYDLLSDLNKKRQYDHIYKYGGFDEEKEQNPRGANVSSPVVARKKKQTKKERIHVHFHHSDGVPKGGIGFKATDPLSYINGKATTTFAGVQVPSRSELASGIRRRGFSLSFSTGQYTTTSDGARQFINKLAQDENGESKRDETENSNSSVVPDARQGVVTEGENYEDKKSVENSKMDTSSRPWYMSAWNGIRDNLTKCHNPCGEILAQ